MFRVSFMFSWLCFHVLPRHRLSPSHLLLQFALAPVSQPVRPIPLTPSSHPLGSGFRPLPTVLALYCSLLTVVKYKESLSLSLSSCLSAKDREGIPTALQQSCRKIYVAYGAASSGGGGSPVLVNAPDEARNLESETIPVGVDSNAQVPSVCGCFWSTRRYSSYLWQSRRM